MRTLLIAALLLAGHAAAEEIQLTPTVTRYSVGWGSLGIGDGTIRLSAEPEQDCYRYERRTHPIGLVRWTYGSPRELSLFCIRAGVIRPSHFEYVNDKREKDNFTVDFDWVAHKAKTVKRGVVRELELPEIAYDRLTLDQAVRLWAKAHAADADPQPMDFIMVDDDRVTPYTFAIKSPVMVETPAGRFEALRVQRIDNPKRSLRSWLAPARDYLPVKIEQIEDGDVQLRMLLQ